MPLFKVTKAHSFGLKVLGIQKLIMNMVGWFPSLPPSCCVKLG